MADAGAVSLLNAFGLADSDADAYLAVLEDLRKPVEELRGVPRASVEAAVRDRFEAAGLSHLSAHLVRNGAALALTALYGKDVEVHVGPDSDEEARRVASTGAVDAVRRNRRGMSHQQLVDTLAAEFAARGLDPLPPVAQDIIVASFAAPVLPIRRLDDLGTAAYAAAYMLRGVYSLVQKLRHDGDTADDGTVDVGAENSASSARGTGGRHRKP